MKERILFTLMSCGLGLLGGADRAATEGGPAAGVDSLFASMSGGPGAAVLVSRDGKVLLAKGYGLADVRLGSSIGPETRFNIASISKPFTALAVLKLREAGRLSLDDSLARYLPESPNAARVTLRQLLTHTSGLPDFVPFDQAMSGPLDFEPGDRLNYSNIGYSALGRVIEKVSGRSYEDYLRVAILDPLGLVATGVDHGDGAARAMGYGLDAAGRFVPIAPQDRSLDPAAGGLVSTVGDLFRLDQALYGSELLPAKVLSEAFAPVRLTDGRTGHYGFGWMVGSFRGLREIAHGGDIDGFNSFLARYPSEKFTVVVLANYPMASSGALPSAGDLAHRIVELYLGDRLETRRIPFSVDPATLAAYVGQYRIEGPPPLVAAMGEVLTVTVDGGRLMGSDRNGRSAALEAESDTVFASTGGPITLTFVRDASGKVDGLVVSLAGLREFRARRVLP
jgi:CubicO group peptidase (beta-lactamase class C family)